MRGDGTNVWDHWDVCIRFQELDKGMGVERAPGPSRVVAEKVEP